MKANFTVELGALVSDIVTGFSGRVTGRVQYITGCNQYLVVPQASKPGEFPQANWIDEDRLKVDVEVKPLRLTARNDGPDKPAPVK